MPDNNPNTTAKKQFSTLGKSMLVIGWIIVLALLTTVFRAHQDHQVNPNKTAKSYYSKDSREVRLQRNKWGHYVANGFVNGTEVTFMLDTGATLVTLPNNIAKKVGLKKGYPLTSSTANGNIEVFMTTIDELQLGNIVLKNVKASINPHMNGSQILLGMSFLKYLEMTQKGEILTLRQ